MPLVGTLQNPSGQRWDNLNNSKGDRNKVGHKITVMSPRLPRQRKGKGQPGLSRTTLIRTDDRNGKTASDNHRDLFFFFPGKNHQWMPTPVGKSVTRRRILPYTSLASWATFTPETGQMNTCACGAGHTDEDASSLPRCSSSQGNLRERKGKQSRARAGSSRTLQHHQGGEDKDRRVKETPERRETSGLGASWAPQQAPARPRGHGWVRWCHPSAV